jgi:tetratricopeptide (TPR) repeat protein
MPQSACLHIQDSQSGPIRVVEIPWITVRIGRAAYCEVRLPDQGVADEACRLQRRGGNWFLVPLGSKGAILVQDQAVASPRPLPFDIPFSIGSCCLTLRESRSADPDWGMYQAPSAPGRGRQNPAGTSRPSYSLIEEGLAQRAAAVSPPLPKRPVNPDLGSLGAVNPWEARWKAAGARLRPTAEEPPKVTRPQPLPTGDQYSGAPLKEPKLPAYQPATPPAYLPPRGYDPPLPHAAGSRPASARLERSTGFWDLPASPPRPVHLESQDELPGRVRPELTSGQDEVTSSPWAEQRFSDEAPEAALGVKTAMTNQGVLCGDFEDVSAALRDFESADPDSGDVSTSVIADEIHGSKVYEAPAEPAEVVSRHEPCTPEEDARQEIGTSQEPRDSEMGGSAWITEPIHHFVADTAWPVPISFVESCSAHALATSTTTSPWHPSDTQGLHRDEPSRIRTASLLDQGPPPVRSRRGGGEETKWPVNPGSRPGVNTAGASVRSVPDLPSAKEILASAPRRPSPQPLKQSARTDWDRAKPTEALEPEQWPVPLWLAWPPTAFLVLLMGIAASLLSFWWAGESSNATVITQRLLARAGLPGREREQARERERPLPETVVPPEPSWWRTTPRHLAQWGVYLGRLGPGDEQAIEPQSLLDGAVRIAPINPIARLAQAQTRRKPGDPSALVQALGLSRDAASLAWTARTLRLAGKKASALKVYRKALEIACRADPPRAIDLAFDDDPNVRRYLLPGEAAAAPIARELIIDGGWTSEAWSGAVPDDVIALLAAGRVLHEQGGPEARTMLLRIIDRLRRIGNPERDADPPIKHAAAAEAYALLSQWKESEQEYRLAIEQTSDLTTRRSWWFNLASVAQHLDDETQRAAALEAALEAPISDDISRRAMEFRRAVEPFGRLRSSGAKAN